MRRFVLKGVAQLEDGVERPGTAIVIEDGRITYAGPGHDPRPTARIPSVDGNGWLVAPGYIDLQLNGAYGHDFTGAPDAIQDVASRLPETGVVAFLPTFITSPLDAYSAKLDAVFDAQQAKSGARVLGAHLEGPFLDPQKPGAHDPELFCLPSPTALIHFSPLEAVRLVTLAPVGPTWQQTVQLLRRRGITVGIGHSAANEETALAAFEAGVTYGTHLFNAMPPLHHREPGLVGALLTSDDVRCGLIVDGIHVCPRIVDVAWRCLRSRRLTLITDAMAAMGMPPGRYDIGNQSVKVDESTARLDNGRLAGSILRMDEAVRHMITFTGCSPAESVYMASTAPAQVLGLDHRAGHVLPGYPADLVVLDCDLDIHATLIRGRMAYATGEARTRFEAAGIDIDP